MIEGQAGALLEALTVLVRSDAARAVPVLRRALAELIEEPSAHQASDLKAPPAQEHGRAVISGFSSDLPNAASPQHAKRPMHRLPAKATPCKGGATMNRSNEVREWLALREQVQAERHRRGITLQQLASATHYTFNTLSNSMKQRSPPSASMAARLRAFAAGGASNGAQQAEAPDGPPLKRLIRHARQRPP